MMRFDRLCVVIPCHNEEACIDNVLAELEQRLPGATLAVVDDASTDRSREIIRKRLGERCILLALPFNLGIGGAVQTGLRYAEQNGFEYAVKFDGDGQHPASGIEALLKPLETGEANLTIGARFLEGNRGYHSTFSRRIGILIFELLNSLLIGQRITDNTSGFRAYNRQALEFAAQYYPSFDYPEPEEVILMARNGYRIREVSVEMLARQGGRSSIGKRRAVYYMCKVIFAVLMAAIRPRIRRKEQK